MSWDAYEDGNFVSADQYIVNTPGILLPGYWLHVLSGLRSLSWSWRPLMAKQRFKQWLWELAATEIRHLHSDNGISMLNSSWKIARTSTRLNCFLE